MEALRKEFEAYKQATEARIRSLEKAVAAEKNGAEKGRSAAASPDLSDLQHEIDDIQAVLKHATMDFDFYGYFRSGLGVDGDGHAHSAFKAPNAEAKYRLGNEAETYVETGFSNRMKRDETTGGASFDSFVMLAYVTPNSNNNTFEATTSLREAYSEAVGILSANPTATFWAGQRYYSRYDVHMNDFFYRDMSGYGGGIENVTLPDGKTKFALAWLGGSIDKLKANGTAFRNPDGRFHMNTLDTTLTDMPVPGGTLDLFLTLSRFEGDSVSNQTGILDLTEAWGGAGGLVYTLRIGETGRNLLAVQYGMGAASNFRALNNLIWDLNGTWSVQGVAIYQHTHLGTGSNDTVDWYSAGVRPVYHFNRYVSLATEFGYDHTDKDGAESGDLFKVTFAPQIKPAAKSLSRPSLRLFFTYAWWSDEFRGLVGTPSYTDDTDGLSAGVQVEAWF